MSTRISTHSPTSRNPLPIGVFDSGVGGLTVWRELRRRLPEESIVYFGDTARVPYGERTPTEILQFGHEIVDWLVQFPVKLIVVACNTSSALALDQLRRDCPIPILGLILPGAREAVHRGRRIGVIATPATVTSRAYTQALLEISAEEARLVQCWEQACPEFVPLIEQGCWQDPDFQAELNQVTQIYLQPLLDHSIDTLIYGCTHYPLLEPILRPLLAPEIQIVDPAIALVEAVVQELDLWGLRQHESTTVSRSWQNSSFFVSGDPSTFAQKAERWLGQRPHTQKSGIDCSLRAATD